VVAALTKRAAEIPDCTLVGVSCPALVDKLEVQAGAAGKCMEYDLGTVANCEARIATYESCSDFEKGCPLVLRQSMGTCTSTADAGATDAPSEGG
jgi:hypothetical protein